MNVEPRQTMRIMKYSVHLDPAISVGAQSPRFGSLAPGLPHAPAEAAGGRKILEHFFQALLGEAQLSTALLRHARLHLHLRLFDPFVHSAHLRVGGSAGGAFAAAPAA